jgi:NTE family protein
MLITFLSVRNTCAQKVALALSGGGADGLSHIGVLKSLEENHIPIDYIAGTSMGALIGALYASGYSPAQIEAFALSEKFQTWAVGDIEERYIYYFKKKAVDASWITYKFSIDTTFRTSIPTNLVDPIPIDFGLLELFSIASAASKNNFDSLMIPFRCVASDITTKKQTIFNTGNLGQCVRASMSYPFYLKPITIDGKLYFDGGLYNNFPVDVAQKVFKPDVIIGSTVSENVENPNEDDIISQVKSMMVNRDRNIDVSSNAIIIVPNVANASLFDFSKVSKLIQLGHDAAELKIADIKKLVTKSSDKDSLECLRQRFVQKENRLVFENIDIDGLKKGQKKYVRNLLQPKGKLVTLEEIKPLYYRLVADEKIRQIYPLANFNPKTGYYQLKLALKKQKDVSASFGGNFSSRPINEAYIGLQYNYLSRIGAAFFANSYFGKLYGSYQFRVRLDFPTRIPFNFDMSYTRNRYDFFKSSTAFFEDVKPSYLVQYENYFDANFSLPTKNKSKLTFGASNIKMFDDYYQEKSFTSVDTADRTTFNSVTAYLLFERNTLNKKQYANSGTYLAFKARAIEGMEYNYPGSTSPKREILGYYHLWYRFKFTYDTYYKRRGALRLGFFTETVFSNQDFFNNYTASLLASPAFTPLPESKTRFLPNFRAHVYTSIGLKNVINFYKNFDLRIEAYVFQPYKEVLLTEVNKKANYGPEFGKRYFMATTGVVYHSPLGPVSLHINYFDRDEFDRKQGIYSILFSFGYILFNKKGFD